MRLDLIGAYIDAQADSGTLTATRGTDYGDGTPNFNIDIAGNDLPNVSKAKPNAHRQKTMALMGGRADFHLLANYRSSCQLNIYNELPVIPFVDRPADSAAEAAYDAFKASFPLPEARADAVNPLTPVNGLGAGEGASGGDQPLLGLGGRTLGLVVSSAEGVTLRLEAIVQGPGDPRPSVATTESGRTAPTTAQIIRGDTSCRT